MMQVHFLHWHVQETVVILDERNFLHQLCLQCDMMVPWCTLNGRHPVTTHCARGVKRKMQRLAEAEFRESTERSFDAYGHLLEIVTVFKYLVQVMTA